MKPHLAHMFLPFLALLLWFGAAPPLAAQAGDPIRAASCTPTRAEHLADLAALPASPARLSAPNTRLLMLGVTSEITIDPPNTSDPLRYGVFYANAAAEAVPLPDVTVSATAQKTVLSLVAPRDMPQGPVTLVITGCPVAAAAVSESGTQMPPHLAVLRVQVRGPEPGRLFAGLTLAGILGIVWLFAGGFQRALKLNSRWEGVLYCFTGRGSRVSLSLVQLFIFTAAVALSVVYHYVRTGQLTDLSADVLLLLGISGAGAAGGAWSETARNRLSWDNWHWLNRHGAYAAPGPGMELRLSQLVTTRGKLDLYRLQALIFTLIVAPSFVLQSWQSLGTAEIPQGLLAVLGLSQATYLVGKFADTPTMADFGTVLDGLRGRLRAGVRLTEAGLRDLQAQFAAAMGQDWHKDPAPGHDVLTKDELATLRREAAEIRALVEGAQKAAALARRAAGDSPTAVVTSAVARAEQAEAAAKAALATAEPELRALESGMEVNPLTLARAFDAARRAAEEAEAEQALIAAPPAGPQG